MRLAQILPCSFKIASSGVGTTSFCRDDLAYVHDTGHGDFARGAAPALLGMLRRAGIVRGAGRRFRSPW